MKSEDQSSAINLVIGCGVLGFGFDIFGPYGEDSVLRPLVDLGHKYEQWTAPNNITYDIPDNVNLNAATGASGNASVFATKEAFTSHFAAKAGVKGSYGAFSGEFEASFANDTSSESEYTYGLYEQLVQSWSLTLQDWSSNKVVAAVLADPDFTDLPSKYTADNQYLFFRFFAKYGTHFISRVECGARMSYSIAVSKSYTTNTNDISVKLTAEFRGALADTSGNASADFKIADQKWFDNRQLSIRTVGGDTSLIASIAPSYNVNNNGPFEKWLTSAEKMPSPIEFQCTPVAQLFSGERAAAVAAAYTAYANSRVYSESRSDGSTILLSGTSLLPAKLSAGICLVVIDRMDLNVVFVKAYDAGWPPSTSLFTDACAVLDRYAGKSQYIIAVNLCEWRTDAGPTQQMVSLLEGCGAGSALDNWISHLQSRPRLYMNYTLIGIGGIGRGAGFESFQVASNDSVNPAAAAVTGLLIPTSIDNGEDQFQFDLIQA